MASLPASDLDRDLLELTPILEVELLRSMHGQLRAETFARG